MKSLALLFAAIKFQWRIYITISSRHELLIGIIIKRMHQCSCYIAAISARCNYYHAPGSAIWLQNRIAVITYTRAVHGGERLMERNGAHKAQNIMFVLLRIIALSVLWCACGEISRTYVLSGLINTKVDKKYFFIIVLSFDCKLMSIIDRLLGKLDFKIWKFKKKIM